MKKITNEPVTLILQNGQKINLVDINFILFWDIGKENNITANFKKDQTLEVSNMLYRTSLGCRLYDLNISWENALNLALKKEPEAAALLYKLLKEGQGKNNEG